MKDGEIVYGEYKTGDEAKEGPRNASTKIRPRRISPCSTPRSTGSCWTFANLFPGCLIKSIDGIRQKKKFFWDQAKIVEPPLAGRQHELGEAYPRFQRLQHQEDHRQGRRSISSSTGAGSRRRRCLVDAEFMAAVLGKPQK
ncbi:MAG: hypothetical protein MZV70_12125 [Desulfobacterales bacterium]|nr:hypothetical protein [Desulfobacterales bacterium]